VNRINKSHSDLEFPTGAMLTAAEVAAMLGCSTRSVHRFCTDGRLPQPTRVGGWVRWPISALEAFLG
jgi:predicted DNA-binding transcriptional regulator AlpA